MPECKTTGFGACAVLMSLWLAVSPGSAQPPTDSAAPEAPGLLRPPTDVPLPAADTPPAPAEPFLRTPILPPLGFSGRSSIVPREVQESSDSFPQEDRWRIGFPAWDRYGRGHPFGEDYPYQQGNWWDPYNQNVLKGDYPLIGQHTFFRLTAISDTILEARETPIGTTPFESTARPFEEEFFGRPNQRNVVQNFVLNFDLFHGDTSFKPVDWRIVLSPVFNVNYLDVDELAVVNPDVRKGLNRGRTFTALQEYFIETKLLDLGPDYDFVSLRVGSQPFVSDFRGFIFADVNRGVRLFGTRLSNRDQFNLIYLYQAEKDTNSELNTFDDRHQEIVILNYYRQDFIWPGYTAQASLHYNHDKPSFKFDRNNFLVRPDPVGVFQPHELNVFYLGWAGDGHINRFNVNHAFYWALGRDSQNPIANCPQDINAQMAALELSYDRDWARFRASFLWASGDDNPNNSHATGFDSILQNPNFAGGQFSFWQRQAIRLFGVNLVNRESLLPDLRSSKIQGQSNFVNPGLFLFNLGADFDLTPKLRMINNVNFLWFEETQVLETFVFQSDINQSIGTDISTGFEYRPFLNNNAILLFGASVLIPGGGFRDLYRQLDDGVPALAAGFLRMTFTY
ncbi:MAG: hypothetical protein JNM56_18585 [Planctomycetia bacterium]|nr:hypothetical protein [Planctomycetia bacterium]